MGGFHMSAALLKEGAIHMRLRTSLFVGLALLILVATLATAQDVATKADEYLSVWARQGRFSGTVLIAKGGKILLRKGYGMANYEQHVPNTPETVFRIGSITKMFTALSVLQLEERGLLNVTDPVIKYIPELPQPWRAITVHQLLCHKSGVPDFINAKTYSDLDDSRHVENALKEYADKPLLSPPGETFRYSNSGYILLGRIIEVVSGQPYESYLDEDILRPAGMTFTAFDHSAQLVPNRANGYSFDGETVINSKPGDPAFGSAAGALRSTVDDLYKLDRILKSGKLFSAAITTKAWTAYGHLVAPLPVPLEAEYGYGWMIGNDLGHRYVGHGGWVNGFVSDFKRFTDDDAVLIVLSNFETSNYVTVSQDLTAILFGEKYQVPVEHKIVHPAPDVLARYVGNYQLGPLAIKITMRNKRLYAMTAAQPAPFGMIATSDTEFYFNDAASVVRFVVDDKGAVNQFMLKIGDKELPVTRVVEPQPGN
jgi:CubicO group peptidase (beta-lactamase class C family)